MSMWNRKLMMPPFYLGAACGDKDLPGGPERSDQRIDRNNLGMAKIKNPRATENLPEGKPQEIDENEAQELYKKRGCTIRL